MISGDSMIAAISALGTVGAVIVALRISRKSDELRETQDKKRQRIYAARILPILKAHSDDLNLLLEDIKFESRDDNDEKGYHRVFLHARIWAEHYRTLPTTDALAAESLLVIPDNAALRLAYAMGMLEAVAIDISTVEPEKYTNFSKIAQIIADEWAERLLSARNHMGAAIDLLNSAANINEFSPDEEKSLGVYGMYRP